MEYCEEVSGLAVQINKCININSCAILVHDVLEGFFLVATVACRKDLLFLLFVGTAYAARLRQHKVLWMLFMRR